MKHFLAYGNSDQVSFRDPRVRNSLQYMTVPGTIAAYYQDATAAFVLSSDLDYIIDPRTPLFQGRIDQPKASHYALAALLGGSIASHMGDASSRSSVQFGPELYSDDVVNEFVQSIVAFQRTYGRRATMLQAQMDRYSRLAAMATGQPEQIQTRVKAPSFVLAPYFAARSIQDPWWEVNERIWLACCQISNPGGISPVLAVDGVEGVDGTFPRIPTSMSDHAFFWIAGFDERRASIDHLRSVWRNVSMASSKLKLTNLYGGFFSICMEHAWLWGFSNGLTYSESRDWPELPATGAAPARYYIPALHLFAPPVTAQFIIDSEQRFACVCAVCVQRPRTIATLSYHQLKAHFALARHEELRLVREETKAEVADRLDEAASLFEVLKGRLPRIPMTADHLTRWASVLRQAPDLGGGKPG